jgi:peptidoglycan/xylan/chitin deacetylase (PgdA/CDA1 family)
MKSDTQRSPVPPITVLTYHNIVGRGQENPNDIHSISIKRLDEHLTALQAAGFVQVSLPNAFDILVNSRDYEPGYVLTFDDGYTSLSTYMEYIHSPIGPTLFILTDYTGNSTFSWNTRSSTVLTHLTLAELRSLSDRGFDIQMHGKDHHNLLKFDENQLRIRFEAANDWFFKNLGKTAEYLAYPYGYCSTHVQTIASEFYTGAVSISHGTWAGSSAQYALNRVSIPYYLRGPDLVAILGMPSEQRWLEIEKRAPWRQV